MATTVCSVPSADARDRTRRTLPLPARAWAHRLDWTRWPRRVPSCFDNGCAAKTGIDWRTTSWGRKGWLVPVASTGAPLPLVDPPPDSPFIAFVCSPFSFLFPPSAPQIPPPDPLDYCWRAPATPRDPARLSITRAWKAKSSLGLIVSLVLMWPPLDRNPFARQTILKVFHGM